MKARKLAIFFGLCFSASTLFAEMYKENVVASYYADKFNGRKTASGEIFDSDGYTAAHKSLPFGTVLKVTNLDNGKSVKVRVNDRGPFVQGREIDVSKAAAKALDMLGSGLAKVSLEIVDEEEGLVGSSRPSRKDEDPYESYDDDDDYVDSSSGEKQGFSFGDNTPFQVAAGSGEPDDAANEEEENEDEPLPPPPPPAKTETKTVKTTTTTTTTTTTMTPKTKTEEPKTKEKEPVVEETPAKRWDIQLGAYSNEGNAKVMAHKLLQAGFENVAYQKVGNIIRVVLRDIDEADLDTFQTKLDESGFTSYIVRERKNIIKKD